MLNRDQIERILRDETEKAKEVYHRAHADFKEIAANIPSGLPHPDGTDRIINAGKAYRFTMNAYDQTLREYNTFILTGQIPERLKHQD